MQARNSSVNDQNLQKKLSKILSKLASGVHPTVEEILEVRILFQMEPFHLNCLYPRHKVSECFKSRIADFNSDKLLESPTEDTRIAYRVVP